MKAANWNYPTSVRFGAGRLAELGDACAQVGIRRPLVVTDPGLAGLPMTAACVAATGRPTAVFSQVSRDPTGDDVAAGVRAFVEGGHDGVVALGGGAAMDAAKAIAFMSGQRLPLWRFEDIGDNWTHADPAGIAPVIAIPTTAGTGSEVGRASVILDEAAEVKRIIFHPAMLPKIVILDPELTVSLPPAVTAATGMDALSHCLEALCAPGFHPMADGIAVEGIRLAAEWLPRAYRDGADIEARGAMQVAASMGATAFQKGLGGMHALAHPIGALHHTHHGLTNAVLMPYVLAFNAGAIADPAERLRAALGLSGSGASGIVDWVLGLRSDLGIAHTLQDLGVGGERAAQIASMAAVDPSAAGNPVPFGEAAARSVFEAAVAGTL